MIKRTPQEISDFFGCYVAQDDERNWWIYENKPFLDGDCWQSDGKCFEVEEYLIEIDVPEDHIWTKVYSPNASENLTCSSSTVSKMEKIVGISEKETSSIADNKEQHVTYPQYIVACGGSLATIEESVNFYMSEGYLPFGSLGVNGHWIYQPMIKQK